MGSFIIPSQEPKQKTNVFEEQLLTEEAFSPMYQTYC